MSPISVPRANDSNRLFTPWGALYFTFQLVIATLGAMFIGISTVLFTSTLVGLILSGRHGSFSRALDDPVLKLFGDGPYFIGPILAGIMLGWVGSRRFKICGGAWIWIIPTLVLLWNVMTWKSYSPLPHWADVRANFFGNDCGDSECLYELVVTGPFYTSVAYTIGWILGELPRG